MLRDVPERSRLVAELAREGLRVTEWSDEPGAVYTEHAHETAEVRVVLEGSMAVTTRSGTFELRPGDRIDLAPAEPHAAVVGPDGVRYLAGTRAPGGDSGRV